MYLAHMIYTKTDCGLRRSGNTTEMLPVTLPKP